MASNTTIQHGFAISCHDGLWVANTVKAGGKWRLVLGVKEEQMMYPTREAAQLELDYMAPGEEGYEIKEIA